MSAAGKPRVLVAEDNPGLARVLAFTLQRAGFDVTVCYDGEAAWAALQAEPFDALVTDYEMPGMTGAELCRRLRTLLPAAQVPALMVTGRELELNVPQMKAELQLAAIHPKPYSPRTIVESLTELLRSNASARWSPASSP